MKKKIIMLILLIMAFGLGVGATILLQSNQVLYKNDKTVEEALNDLYTKSNIGDATASDIKAGKKALVGGKEVTGSLTCPTCDYSNYVAKSSITNLSGTQNVGAGAYSTLLNGYYNLSDYRIKCGSNSCSACNSCCSCPSCNSCCSGGFTADLYMQANDKKTYDVTYGHYYLAWASGVRTLNSGGTVLSSPGNMGSMRGSATYGVLFKATSTSATFNGGVTLVHLGY